MEIQEAGCQEGRGFRKPALCSLCVCVWQERERRLSDQSESQKAKYEAEIATLKAELSTTEKELRLLLKERDEMRLIDQVALLPAWGYTPPPPRKCLFAERRGGRWGGGGL